LDLVKTGLERAGTSLFQKLLRLRGVDKTLRAGSFINPAVEKAMSDLQIVFGSYHGILDVSLARFLSELKRSGLITIMAEEAILQQSTSATLERFLELYKQIMDGDIAKGSDLYKAITLGLVSSITAMLGNDAQALIIQTFGRNLLARLERIEAARLRPAALSGLGPDELNSLLLRLGRALQNAYRPIRIETNKGPKQVGITDIYTPARLTLRGQEETDLKTLLSGTALHHRRGNVDKEIDEFAFGEFRDTFSRAVVLGDPGGGKSTLCQFICFEMTKQSVLALQTNDVRIPAQIQRIPFRIVLRLYETARLVSPQLSLFEYCAREIEQAVTAPIETCREL
jgi:hypothetical protein